MQERLIESVPHKVAVMGGRSVGESVECCACGLYGLCRVAGLESSSPVLIDAVVKRSEAVAAGDSLFADQDAPREIVAVKSGAFKASVRSGGAEERIVGFFLPGELIGMESVTGGTCPYTVEALKPAHVCRLNLARLHRFEPRHSEFQRQLILALGRQLHSSQDTSLLLGATTAEQRMALFLLGLSTRLLQHGLQGGRFKLPMSRRDIASYLGLAMETVSRVFKRFHARGLIAVRARDVALLDMRQLREAAGLGA